MNNNEKLASTTKRIRAIRESKNYSQVWMGEKLGISQNAYSKLEIGQTELTIERLYQIADIFNMSAHDILS